MSDVIKSSPNATNRIVVITGAAGGIGAALVKAFIERGYRVIALDNATSKAALSDLTRAMAVDLGGRVRVNAIEPAAIATDMLKAGFAGEPERYTQLEGCHPQGRIGTPKEVAALAVSIADGALRFLHGACIGMDGGISGCLHDPG